MLVINQSLTLGMFFAFQSYRGQFTGRINSLIGLYFSFRTVGLHVERLADIVYADQEKGIDAPLMVGKKLSGQIEVRNLRFRYGDNEPWVLDGVNITINPQDRIALIGPSGGGKTTLLKQLIGLHNPVEGEVLYDGRSLASTGVRAIRNQIGVVMQDDRLLSGSLYENISFFDPEMDMELVESCARAAYVYGPSCSPTRSRPPSCGSRPWPRPTTIACRCGRSSVGSSWPRTRPSTGPGPAACSTRPTAWPPPPGSPTWWPPGPGASTDRPPSTNRPDRRRKATGPARDLPGS